MGGFFFVRWSFAFLNAKRNNCQRLLRECNSKIKFIIELHQKSPATLKYKQTKTKKLQNKLQFVYLNELTKKKENLKLAV